MILASKHRMGNKGSTRSTPRSLKSRHRQHVLVGITISSLQRLKEHVFSEKFKKNTRMQQRIRVIFWENVLVVKWRKGGSCHRENRSRYNERAYKMERTIFRVVIILVIIYASCRDVRTFWCQMCHFTLMETFMMKVSSQLCTD